MWGERGARLEVLTAFCEDLTAAKRFYAEVFEAPCVFENDDSAVFRVGEVLVNLLDVASAPELVAPASVAPPGLGDRVQLTIPVEDVDAVCEELGRRGVALHNGPMDRWWGMRTASFRDPAGLLWEVAADLA
jgi:catechol 2,3-dioxygenase-like lactoylglutathione lyase family enzyme